MDLSLEQMALELGLTPKTTAAYGQRLGLKRNTIFPTHDDEEFKSLSPLNYSRYRISNYGTIIDENGVLLKSHPHHQSNYLQIRLYDDSGTRKSVLVHKLVADLFIENNDNNLQIDHIDGNPQNNYVLNLQYITASENVQKSKPRNNATRYLRKDEVEDICKKLENGMSISEICSTNDFYTKSKVEKIKQRVRWVDISKNYNF